ncbi:MAG TPA: RNA polymerase sigma factor [Candidatus Hypogeohydataceae bacterium YC38]|nr:RNA polymerase sigma factor [Candidatus Brocadiales bacterium]
MDRLGPESDLIKRIQEGDEEAFTELVERYKEMGFSLAYHFLGNPEDARDVSQEAFAQVYLKIKDFRGESSFKTWFFTIILNLCRKQRRRRASPATLSDSNLEEELGLQAQKDVEEEVERAELGVAIEKALKELSSKQREVFIMKHMEGMKISEISGVLNCAEGTVKIHLFRAVRALQERLKEWR